MSLPLILAPLKKIESLTPLINAGADMVYSGYSSFSRGGISAGLNDSEMSLLVEKTLKAGKKAVAALNAIPDNMNESAFFNTVEKLFSFGIKDIILNDAGLISSVKRIFPDLKITASVGCGILNFEDVLFFEDSGADTVVLNPIVTPYEAREIREKTKIQLELFIFFENEFIIKGKCLLTGYIKEGSSKKGVNCGKICAYKWLHTESEIDDTLKNTKPVRTSLIDLTEDYIKAGIDIFKIEGRNLPEKTVLDVVKSVKKNIQSASND